MRRIDEADRLRTRLFVDRAVARAGLHRVHYVAGPCPLRFVGSCLGYRGELCRSGNVSGHFSAPLGRFDWIDGVDWRLVDGFRYYLTPDEGGEFVEVPAGFVTNFASVPRVLQNLCPPTGKSAQIAVVHDKLFPAPVIRTPASARPCT